MRMGELVPIACIPVLPGDVFQHHTSALIRTTPLLAPVMHPVHVKIEHWFVPNRLIWTDWENFITGGPDGLNASTPPTITVNTGTGWAVGSLADYFGIPTLVDDQPVSALPFRAYAKIWNDNYRDPDLSTALTIDLTDGADTTTNTALQMRAWEKDYYTTARLTPQKGTQVTLPLGTSAPVVRDGTGVETALLKDTGTNTVATSGTLDILAGGKLGRTVGGAEYYLDNTDNQKVDLTLATAATINELREAFAVQKFMENRSRYGGRYVEYLRDLGVTPSDARLQRAEYLGGGKETIQFSEVLQTGGTDAGGSTGVGNLKGHGIGAIRSNKYRRFFEEHGYVITLLSVIPKTMYVTGLQREWNKSTKEDYWQKELQHIGQQTILNKELYLADSGPNDTFGYQDRYDEYRRIESGVSGEMRASTYNFWHLARIFAADVTLNASFVMSDPSNRINADQTNDTLIVTAQHHIKALRLVSRDGSPI